MSSPATTAGIGPNGAASRPVETNRHPPGRAEADLNVAKQHVELFVQKYPLAKRILLGEVEIIGQGSGKEQEQAAAPPMPRPMHVKSVLDSALLAAGVDFLYSSYVTDILRDSNGRPCGVVMVNRAGRQAILAKTIIDATDRARVARLAGAAFRPFPGGTQTLKRVVIGGEICKGPSMTAREIMPRFRGPHPNQAQTSSGEFAAPSHRCTAGGGGLPRRLGRR